MKENKFGSREDRFLKEFQHLFRVIIRIGKGLTKKKLVPPVTDKMPVNDLLWKPQNQGMVEPKSCSTNLEN